MMSSRSIASTVKLFAVALVAALTLIALPRPAAAAGGKKLVILEFEGPKGDKFRADVEAALKKGNTLVSLDKWQAKAEDLGAEKVTARNVKKIAAKLKVDGVIQGDVEKRGSRYYIHIKLREGNSGDYVAEVEIVVRAPKLGSDGAKVIKEELLPAIKELRSFGKGDDDDDEDADDDDKPKKGKTKKSGFGRKGRDDEDSDDEDSDEDSDDEDADDEDDDAEEPPPKKGKKAKKAKAPKKTKKAKKPEPEPEPEDDEDSDDGDADDDEDRVAASDEDDDEDADDDDGEIRRGDDDDDASGPIDPRFPAVDVGAGLSVTQRKLGFTTAAGAGPVQGYKGNMVAGAMVDAQVYPLALNKKNKSITRNVGVTILLDRVVKIESRLAYDNMGTEEVAVLATKQSRYAAGLVYRHAVNDQITVQGQLRYNRMKFVIDRDDVPAGVVIQIPNVNYTFVDPGVSVRYASSPKLMFGAGAAFLFVMNTGDMQEAEQYGAAKVSGFDLDAGADYVLAPRIIVSAEARYTTFGFSFDGSGALSDPNADGTIDVPKGSDSYLGAAVTASYLF